jgi:tetratricopeptide (TPR) repeat protein
MGGMIDTTFTIELAVDDRPQTGSTLSLVIRTASQVRNLKMARFFLGQKNKAKAAFEQFRETILSANQNINSGKFDAALVSFDEIIETLKSNSYHQWQENRLIEANFGNEQMAGALLGRIRALVGTHGRKIAFRQAETMMFDVYALKPDWLEASEYLANLAISRGEMSSGKIYINKMFAVNQRHPRARFLQAVFDFQNANYDEAAKALASLADSPESLTYLARCQMRTGRLDAAIKTLERARSRFADNYELRYFSGCALAQAGRYEEATSELKAAASIELQRVEPLIQLGHLCLFAGDVRQAEAYYKSAIAFGTRTATGAHYGLALLATHNGKEEFQSHLDSIFVVEPSGELLSCAKGNAFERAGQYDQARNEYEKMSSASVMSTAVLMRLGLMSFRTGDFTGSLNHLRQVIQLRPTDDRLLDVIGCAAAVTGEYRAAETAWSQMEARNTADAKTLHALDNTRLWGILEVAYQGQAADAIEPLERLHKKWTNDALVSQALADVYFLAAIEALSSVPPAAESAQEYLMLGKHLTAHVRFDYTLALSFLIAGRYDVAAARLPALLKSHPSNSGAAYHLGLALFHVGDRRGAEQAFRQGIQTSQKDPARLKRMKWGLIVVLFSEQRWAEALQLLNELIPSDFSLTNDIPPQASEMIMRCHALMGDWESAERLAIGGTASKPWESPDRFTIGGPAGRQTALGTIILARRNMKSMRLDAALPQLEGFLKLADKATEVDIINRVKRTIAQLSLKLASQRVRESRFEEAEGLLTQSLTSLAEWREASDLGPRINEFLQALRERQNYPQRVERLAASYDTLAVDAVLEKSDLQAMSLNIPIVLPPKSQRALDQVERPVFDTSLWNASPYPEFLVAFDS